MSLLSLFISSLVLRQFTFTFDVVNVNYVQLTDACDQGRTVETCCAKENKILRKRFLVVCLRRGQGKEKTEQ